MFLCFFFPPVILVNSCVKIIISVSIEHKNIILLFCIQLRALNSNLVWKWIKTFWFISPIRQQLAVKIPFFLLLQETPFFFIRDAVKVYGCHSRYHEIIHELRDPNKLSQPPKNILLNDASWPYFEMSKRFPEGLWMSVDFIYCF